MGIPKATEDTITSILTNEINKLGVIAESFYEIKTPKGYRKPDIYCANGGNYVVEAKFSERDLIDAISKIQNDYLKFSRTLGINGGFAILYPEKLSEPMPLEALRENLGKYKFKILSMFPENDDRSFNIEKVQFNELPKIIVENVKHEAVRKEQTIKNIISTLRDSAVYLVNGLAHLSGSDLINFFGGENVFKNILEHKDDKHTVEEMRLAAAYLLINQLLFYRAISKFKNGFEEIDPDAIRTPKDLTKYFSNVTDINYRVVFSYAVAPLIPNKFISQVQSIVGVVNGLAPEKVGGELLGMIFHDLIPLKLRKKVAAYYTNVSAARLLADLLITDYNQSIADFSCGSGGLLVASYARKRSLYGDKFNYEVHRQFVEQQILGVDVMPFAANVAACNLSLQSPQFFTDKLNVAVWDSTDLEPGKAIPSASNVWYTLSGQLQLEEDYVDTNRIKGVVRLSKETPNEISLKKVDIVIMNPPFTRQERLPNYYKDTLRSRFKSYEDFISTQMSFFGYFVFLADKFLKNNGRMGIIVPAAILVTQSNEGIRRFLAENYFLEYIIVSRQTFGFSESSLFKDVILIAKKTSDHNPDLETKIIFIKNYPGTINKAMELARQIGLSRHANDLDDFRVVLKKYADLKGDVSNWYKEIALDDLTVTEALTKLLNSKVMVKLSKICPDVSRTDLKHFKIGDFEGYLIKESERANKNFDVWVIEQETDDYIQVKHKALDVNLQIPKSKVKIGIRRITGVKTYCIDEFHDYILVEFFDDLEAMIEHTLPKKSKEKDLVRKALRNFHWKKTHESKASNLLISRRPFLESPGTYFVSFYSDVPAVGVNLFNVSGLKKDDAKILCMWLNSSFSIGQMLLNGAARDGNWTKIDQYMVENFMVPDPDKLTAAQRKKILDLYEKGRSLTFPSIRDQLRYGLEFRKEVDTVFLQILLSDRVMKSQISEIMGESDFTESLYETLVREFDALSSMEKN